MIDQHLLTELQARCAARSPWMLELLEEVVRQNSYTWNKAGADAVAATFEGRFLELGLHVEREPQENVGDILVARTPATVNSQERQILFCGHLDTVFPQELGFDCFEVQGDRIRGPGIIDMKGGLVAALQALDALKHTGHLDSLPITFVVNSDEEVGSPFSTSCIQREARRSAFAFVFECCGMQGQMATSRKGKHGCSLHCKGRAGHVGQAGTQKPSAILELARKIVAVEACNAVDRGLTCNVGQIQGGTTPNAIPEHAWAAVDCRFLTAEDAAFVQRSLEEIAGREETPGVQTTLETTSKRPPMEATAGNRRLFRNLQPLAESMHIQAREETRGGVSDANTISALGIPVLDGLGPSGDRDHSSEEYMLTESLAQRSALAAAGVLACWEDHRRNV